MLAYIVGILKDIWRLFFVAVVLNILYQQITCSNSIEKAPLTTEVLAPQSLHQCDLPPEAKDLPKLNSSFIGREANMTHLERVLLSDSVHVLGINGPPGFGKSSLAIHLGWRMRKNQCFTVGYIDLEREHEILSYVVEAFNEQRLVAYWRPPMELTSEDFKEKHFFAEYGLEWFNSNRALLIVDNCNQVLKNEKHRKQFFKFLEAMIRGSSGGKIMLTSDEQLNLDSKFYKYQAFTLGNLSTEASVELLKDYSPGINAKDAKEIAIAVENCPIVLRLMGSLLKGDSEPMELLRILTDHRQTLAVLNDTEFEHLNFISVMNVASSFLVSRERMSAMYFSFFPRHFPLEAAVEIMMQSNKKYNVYAGIVDSKSARESIKGLKYRSLLEKSYLGEVKRYKMHRLIKVYFMNEGERHDDEMNADFNSSFRIYFSELGVRYKLLDEVRSQVENKLSSDHDNFDYLLRMLLSSFNIHMYSEDELIYLAFAFHKGLIHFDHSYFKVLLELFTHPRPRVAKLPAGVDLTEERIHLIASDFNNFFVNVICKVTSEEVCTNVYMDILYKLYEAEKCNETFEDNVDISCRMVNCDYARDYFTILSKLKVFEQCSNDVSFCSLLSNVQFLCSAFDFLLPPLKYALLSFLFITCAVSVITIATCFRVRKISILFCKHLGLLVLIYLCFVIPTYTLAFRKYIGVYLEAPLEVHGRNVVASIAFILYIVFAFLKILQS